MKKSFAERVLERRESWVEVEPGKEVCIRRPAETEIRKFVRDRSLFAGLEHAREFVFGWRGITEADLLGEAIGSDQPAEFSRELWTVVIDDRLAWLEKIAEALIQAIVSHNLAKTEDEKN